MNYTNPMKRTNHTKREQPNREYHQLSVKIPKANYDTLMEIVGPHTNLASLMREVIQNFIDSKKKDAA